MSTQLIQVMVLWCWTVWITTIFSLLSSNSAFLCQAWSKESSSITSFKGEETSSCTRLFRAPHDNTNNINRLKWRFVLVCVWAYKCMSVFFCESSSEGIGVCRPNACCRFCRVSSKERPAKHRGSMCPSKSGWYEAWGLRPAREMEGWDWLIQKLRNQHVTLSTAHCHSASTHAGFMGKLQATGSHLDTTWVSIDWWAGQYKQKTIRSVTVYLVVVTKFVMSTYPKGNLTFYIYYYLICVFRCKVTEKCVRSEAG